MNAGMRLACVCFSRVSFFFLNGCGDRFLSVVADTKGRGIDFG